MWIGQSGRQYRLLPESLPGFQLGDTHVHVLVSGAKALWAGSADDVVADPQSRARFRQAMAERGRGLSARADAGRESRPIIAWDIVNGGPAGPLKLVDAELRRRSMATPFDAT